MSARIADGWLVVPYDGNELTVYIAVSDNQPTDDDWRPAYRDWLDGQRVAKVRPAGARGHVWLRAVGQVERVGRV